MSLLCDEVVMELYDEEMNYFDLSDEICAKAWKMAAERLLSEEVTWFVEFRIWALSLVDGSKGRENEVMT